jgi:NADH-dependent peroxiredoxin subunit F
MNEIYDLCIVGGGPAGVSAGVYAARKQLKTVFIAKEFGGQSVVSEGIENWIGTEKISGAKLAKDLENHLKAYAGNIVDIKDSATVESITKNSDGNFTIKTDSGEFTARTVLITTGSSRKKLPAINADKFEHKGVTYCASCDGPLFGGQDVVVVGAGNAAFETSAQLLAYCKSVTLLNYKDTFKADEVTVEKVRSHPNMTIITNAVVKEVTGDKFLNGIIYTDKTTGEDKTLAVTGVFVEIGAIPATGFAKGLVEINPFGAIVVDPRNQRTNTDGVWAAGDCTDGLYHQNNIAAGDAVKALEDIYLWIKTK